MIGFLSYGILGALILVSFIMGDTLVARRLNTTLPSPRCHMALYYDGVSDFIYIVGGESGPYYLDSILRFDISTEITTEVGSLPVKSYECPLEADSAGNLVYFECTKPPYVTYKFNTTNNSLKRVGESNYGTFLSASIKLSEDKVLLIGGRLGYNMLEYNMDSDTVQGEVVGQFPVDFLQTAVVKVDEKTALVFGPERSVPYLELDLETFETRDLAVDSFPGSLVGTKITSDRNYVYIFGGDLSNGGLPVDGIIQLEPNTHSWNFIQVENFPIDSVDVLSQAPEVVWVEKLNRIYMFGGCPYENNRYQPSDEIYYIDLNPLTPPTTTPTTTTTSEEPTSTTLDPELVSCVNRGDGTHPHPSDCSKYIACRNGTLEGIYPCSPPLLFDPTIGNCNLPSLVDCELSCEDKEDGTYPHPHECRLFIICSDRELFVFWCYPPLLFDPKELQCTLPDLVHCEDF